ncbi:4186_t:CDS:2, partial [Racocetra persica]
DLLILLEPIYHVTIMLSSSTLPTQGDLHMIFCGLIIHLNNSENPEINSQYTVASAMKGKFTSYWAHLSESSTISGLLDLCNKLSTFDIYERKQAINKLHELYKTEPLLWWKANAALFSTLSHLAMDFLAMQATSVPSEQAFSVAKHTISLTRNHISPKTNEPNPKANEYIDLNCLITLCLPYHFFKIKVFNGNSVEILETQVQARLSLLLSGAT